MGDIKCPTCKEPWDAYHLRHDAIYDTELPLKLCKDLSEAGTPLGNPAVRSALEEDGWSFPRTAISVLSFTRCPSCPKDLPTPDTSTRAVVADMLGDDEDGLQVTLEDMETEDENPLYHP